jgi:hypothetical protein
MLVWKEKSKRQCTKDSKCLSSEGWETEFLFSSLYFSQSVCHKHALLLQLEKNVIYNESPPHKLCGEGRVYSLVSPEARIVILLHSLSGCSLCGSLSAGAGGPPTWKGLLTFWVGLCPLLQGVHHPGPNPDKAGSLPVPTHGDNQTPTISCLHWPSWKPMGCPPPQEK